MVQGRLGGSVGWVSDFSSGHDLVVREFKPRVGGSVLTAQNLEPALDVVSPSLPLPHSRSVSKMNKRHKNLKVITLR